MGRKSERNDSGFVRRSSITIGLAALAFLLWQLRSVLVLFFGAVVVASILRTLAGPLTNRLRLPTVAAVIVVATLLIAAFAGAGWLFGSRIGDQADNLAKAIPQSLSKLDSWFGGAPIARELGTWASSLRESGDLASRVQGVVLAIGEASTDLLIILFGGLFLATKPELYETGAIDLVPPTRRRLVTEAMDETGKALRLWLKGQLMAMVVIGVMTGVGLWLIGVPSPLLLGLLAGFLEFIPFAGPILAAVPGILIALTVSPELALWTLGLYLFVQNSESYLVEPLIQQYVVDVPAAVLLFSLLAFGLLFGALGVIFAAPLAVTTYVLVKRLYVIEALGTPTPIPGESTT